MSGATKTIPFVAVQTALFAAKVKQRSPVGANLARFAAYTDYSVLPHACREATSPATPPRWAA